MNQPQSDPGKEIKYKYDVHKGADQEAHLGATNDGRERALGLADSALQIIELLLEKEAGNRRGKELGHTSSGGVSAMSSAESVIDIHVERSSELLRERLVVLLLLGVETNVLEKTVLSVLQVVDDLRGLVTNAILGHNAGRADELSEASAARGKGVLVLRATLGPSKMGRDGNTGTVVQKILDGRNRGADASVISDLLAIKGHVKVAADEDLM
jgi:hypothetical protein